MNSRIPGIFAVIGLATAVACGDSVAPEDIAGDWTATSFVFTSVDDPDLTADIIDLGGSVSLTLNANGTYSITFTLGGVPETDGGTYTIDGSDITLDEGDSDEVSGTIDLSGDTMTIRLTDGVEFDFDDDGTDESATVVIVLTRD
jgi:hypothetical protein